MNIIIAIQTNSSGAKGFPGTSQVVHPTNQVVRTTLKRPSENTEDTQQQFSHAHPHSIKAFLPGTYYMRKLTRQVGPLAIIVHSVRLG